MLHTLKKDMYMLSESTQLELASTLRLSCFSLLPFRRCRYTGLLHPASAHANRKASHMSEALDDVAAQVQAESTDYHKVFQGFLGVV